MTERSFEEFLADLEARAAEEDEAERNLLESAPLAGAKIRSVVAAASRSKSVASSAPAPKRRPKFCRHCGASLKPEGKFCTQCGQRIAT
jgi:hypothetical protein